MPLRSQPILQLAKPSTAYCNLIHEVRVRFELIDSMLADKGRASFVRSDTCWLQLRLIAETISLALLTLHGDIEATKTKKLWKGYQADLLLRALANIHPMFFPRAAIMEAGREVQLSVTLLDESKQLSQKEIGQLWRIAGEKLHRGNMKGLTYIAHQPFDEAGVRRWRTRLEALLRVHEIRYPAGTSGYVCWFERERAVKIAKLGLEVGVEKAPPAPEGSAGS